jgi:DNA replication and repair protein RecF
MLLDDPMSELDAGRRERLAAVLRRGGQSVVAATELGLVPGSEAPDVVRVAIVEGSIMQAAAEAA